MLQTDELTRIITTLHDGKRFFLIGHLRPDGDVVGSLSGLARSLRKAGKSVDIGLVDQPPERFRFLLDSENLYKPGDLVLDHDAILILDTGDLERTGFAEALAKSTIILINIDHHASNTNFGDINLIDIQAGATCEIIVNLLEKARMPFDSEVAEGLYLGLCTDTRFFQIENLRSNTHHAAQRLLETGLDTRPILTRLLSSRKLSEIRVLGHALLTLTIEMDGRLAWVALKAADLAKYDATIADVFACGIFGQLTSIEGVVVGVGFVENDADGKVYCEFRSKGGFDVKQIAVNLGGGGHFAASGCSIEKPLETAISEVLSHVRNALGEYKR